MTDSRVKTPPRGLKKHGRKLWRSVVPAYTLRPDELVLLESACKTVDLIAELEAAMVDEPLVTSGSMGQLREHPLLSETRQQKALLGRQLAQLKLPDLDAQGVPQAKVNAQREGGIARWQQQWRYGQ
ncbi:hypothetical protein [Nocardioides humi]|uniref:Phage terminase, small subunit, putative, P27 family n=1 Tax=Nocardioides humi TaxID=449461 RepID=A0ABN2BP53_9ACTN|nr:hypothetical protein [Nocardioides humi]